MNEIRRMTFLELARVSWRFWFWGALVGSNLGFAIGELLSHGRWWMFAINLTGGLMCIWPALDARRRSGREIRAFYDRQVGAA